MPHRDPSSSLPVTRTPNDAASRPPLVTRARRNAPARPAMPHRDPSSSLPTLARPGLGFVYFARQT